jgi:cell division protein FtsQ
MATVAAATDKRFRRAHVKPGRKRSLSARRVWLIARTVAVIAVLGFGGWRFATLVADAHGLQIGHLTVRGQERLSAGEVLALVDGLRGQNILLVHLDPWRERLLASPWVEDATLRRVLPSTLEIVVHERRPMGVGRIGTALYLIDRRGVVVDEYGPAYADIDLPIIDGLSASPQDGDALVDTARAEFAGRVIASLATRPELAKRVSQIDVSDLHNAVVILDGDTALLRLGEAEFVERLQQYVELAPALRERLAGIDYVDLRFDERLYVRPAFAKATAGRPALSARK